ncbi:MAG: hypothetical protein QOI98_735, partial [Solirubrobacteraceae bacterium]|nr:hypothetical protein [Solirubrobacteraceae bacterium]
MPPPGQAGIRPGVSPGELDGTVLDVGRDLAAAFPSTARHPLKALDTKAMDLAAQ